MNPCPYCGANGYHLWGGAGGCPGGVSVRDRDLRAAAVITELRKHIELIAEAGVKRERELIGLRALCVRAADALEQDEEIRGTMPPTQLEHWIRATKALIAELREAAEWNQLKNLEA